MRLRFLLFIVLVVGLTTASPASAHTEVQRATPAPGEVVADAVGSVELLFLDPVLPTVEIDVTTAAGEVVDGLGTVEHSDDARTAVVSFAPLDSAGDYVVEYRFVAADGDRQSDAYRFSIDPAVEGDEPSPVGPIAVVVVGAAVLGAVALAVRRRGGSVE